MAEEYSESIDDDMHMEADMTENILVASMSWLMLDMDSVKQDTSVVVIGEKSHRVLTHEHVNYRNLSPRDMTL